MLCFQLPKPDIWLIAKALISALIADRRIIFNMDKILSKIRRQSKNTWEWSTQQLALLFPAEHTFDNEHKISYVEMITESIYGFERIWARKMCVEQMQIHCNNEI